MNKKKFIYFLINFLISLNSYGQYPIPISAYPYFPAVFVGENGKVKFQLPPNHNPAYIRNIKNNIFNSRLKIFNQGIGIINDDSLGLYWTDENGKILKYFGHRYDDMQYAGNGIFLASESFDSLIINQNSYFYYLDNKGNILYGHKFFEAGIFYDDLAAVKIKQESPWSYINTNGQIAFNLTKYPYEKIAHVNSFINGLSKIALYSDKSTNQIDNYVFIDINQKEIINIKKLYPDSEIYEVGDYLSFIKILVNNENESNNRTAIFIDSSGNEHFRIENINDCTDFDGNYCLVSKNVNKNNFINYLIDSSGKRIELQIDGILEEFSDKLVLFHNTSNEKYTLANVYGEIIYESPFTKQIFDNIESTKGIQDSIRFYIINDPKDFKNGLFDLKNLETLYIDSLNITSISCDFTNFKKLKTLVFNDLPKLKHLPNNLFLLENLENLTLDDLENLKSIPAKIENLKNLNSLDFFNLNKVKMFPQQIAYLPKLITLEISNCQNNKRSIEKIIEESKSLKCVILSSVNIEPDFEEKLKKLKPDLILMMMISFF